MTNSVHDADHSLAQATEPSDMEIVNLVRSGQSDTYGKLWQRHYPAARSVARSMTTSFDPDDIVQEAFTLLYFAIQNGGGPQRAFRAYLMTTVRNVAVSWGSRKREEPTERMEDFLEPVSSDAELEIKIEREIIAKAFTSLPERWRRVLWHTEVESLRTFEVAVMLDMRPGAVAQLAFRAREGLREAYLRAHLKTVNEELTECIWALNHAGAYTRQTASKRDVAHIEKHLPNCCKCRKAYGEAKRVNERLGILLPPIVGGSATATRVGCSEPTADVHEAETSVPQEGTMAAVPAGTRGGRFPGRAPFSAPASKPPYPASGRGSPENLDAPVRAGCRAFTTSNHGLGIAFAFTEHHEELPSAGNSRVTRDSSPDMPPA